MNNSNILYVKKLELSNFRNYKKLSLEFSDRPVVITGLNGSGKTNILESISFLAPGRGIRGAKINDIDYNKAQGDYRFWSVNYQVNTRYGIRNISTYRSINKEQKRIVKIDDQFIKSQASLTNIFRVIWLTPQMDQLFISSKSNRRKFLDRIVYNFDPEHSARVTNYENLLRQRMKLIRERNDQSWIKSIEHKIAEYAVAIAYSRVQTIDYLQKAINNRDSFFPGAILNIKGELESKIKHAPSIILEEEFKENIMSLRNLDLKTNRTNIGTHLSDLEVFHEKKNIEASLCSTGEQKLMLITILLSQIKTQIILYNLTPILLLDEITAHLDEHKRELLFDEIIKLKSQAFITGTDVTAFRFLDKKAEFIDTKTLINK